jgi:hypothetical protein
MMTAEYIHEHANVLKVADVLKEIERRKASRRDYVYPAAKLAVNDDGAMVFGDTDAFQVGDRVYTNWTDAEAAADSTGQELRPLGKTGALPLSRTAEIQVCGKLGVPTKYIDFLREGGKHPDLAAHNLTTLLSRSAGQKMLVRTLDGRVRAVLSDRYRILDNADVFFAAAEAMQAAGAVIWNARLTDDRFSLFAVSPDLHGTVTKSMAFRDGVQHGWWQGDKDGDTHNAAVQISNSETGQGGLTVRLGALRAVCVNTSIIGKALSVIHLGKQQGEGEVRYEEDTRESEARTVWLKLRDTISTAFDRAKFVEYLDRLNGLAEKKLAEPEKAVAALAERFDLPDARRADVLAKLFGGRDLTRFGLAQAVTASAKEGDDGEAGRLEEIGGELAYLPAGEWNAIDAGAVAVT